MKEINIDNYVMLYSATDIARQIAQLGALITPWARNVETTTGRQPLAVCVLRGALIFFADLIREIECPLEVECCRVAFYDTTTDKKTEGMLSPDFAPFEVKDRAVLLVDDICDSGSTLKNVDEEFRRRGAIEVKTVTLVYRQIANPSYRPEWIGFMLDRPEWLVGYGVDSKNLNRNSRSIYFIEGTGSKL